MKRKLLFLAALAVSAVGFNAHAQKDVTEKYLVNPSFETLKATDGEADVTPKENLEAGLYGWEVASMSNYCVESEASGSTSGFVATNDGPIVPSDGTYYYFNRQGWGNKDSELKTTTMAEVEVGKYYLVFDYKAADYSNNNNTGNNGTTIGVTVKDATENTLAVNNAVRRSYSLANDDSNPKNDPYMQTAPWTQLGVYFEVETPSVLTFAIQQNMKNFGRSDIAYDNFRLYQIDGSADLDMTGLIANPSFEAANANAWTCSPAAGGEVGAKKNDNGQYSISNADGNYIFNTWISQGSAYSISQKIAGLPAGQYKLSAIVASGADNADQDYTIVLSAGETSENVIVRDKTVGVEGEVEFEHAGDDVEIKVSSDKWFKADNFKLTLLAEEAEEPVTGVFKGEGVYYLYNENTGKFLSRGSWWGTRAVADEYGLPIQVSLDGENVYNLSALDNKLYYGTDYWMYSDKAKTEGDYRTFRINEVEGMEGTYTLTVTTLNKNVYINVIDGTGDYGVANNAEDEADNGIENTYWKFLSQEERDAILEKKDAAITQATAEKAGVENFDDLVPVGEPVVLSFAEGETQWDNNALYEQRAGNVNKGDYGTEVYQGVQKFTQSAEGLEEGLYLVSIKGFFRDGWNDDVSATYADGYDCVLSYLDANGATVRVANWAEEATNNDGWNPDNTAQAKALFDAEGDKYTRTIVTYVGEDGKLDLSVVSPAYTGGCWLILNNVTYTKIGEPEVTVTDAGYATYVTPKDVEFGDEVEAYIVSALNEDNTVATLEPITEAPAGTPVVIKAAKGTYKLSVISEAEEIESENLLKVATGEETGEGIYVLANLNQVVGFYALEEGVKVPAGKAYLEVPAGGDIKFIGFGEGNGDATGIQGVEDAAEVENGTIYNIAGQRVQNPTKGIYIVNGKKVLVK